jgi:meso-butanediol dehydrogenase/(S,S)-butanediol dehydrogenase/diacetyl reductase
MRFANKIVVVTGAASGIGLATARRFHSEGAAVVIADINGAAAEGVVRELGADRCLARSVNVGSWDQVSALMDDAVKAFGGLDVLVNNAAIGSGGGLQMSIEEWQRVIQIDLSGVFYGCRAAVPHMRKRGGGAIINMASSSGLAGDYGATAYCAAKGGVINFTRVTAIDHAREGIRVNAVCPGVVETPILGGLDKVPKIREQWESSIPMGRFARPEELAAVIAFLASADASYVTGSIVSVDGGLMAHTGQPNVAELVKKSM